MENRSHEYLFGATDNNSTCLSILDVNPIDNTNSLHYPIQPYRHGALKRFYASLPSDRYKNIIAYYHQVHVIKDAIHRTIFPTGNTAIVFRCDHHKPGAFLVGTPTLPREAEYVITGCDYFIVLFWPGMGYAFFPIPTKELTDISLSLDELLPGESERITERMVLAKTFEERICIFERFMERRMLLSQEIPNNLWSIIATTCRNIRYLTSEEEKNLESYTCCTERHIRRLFSKYVGITPILLKRIMRHQRTLRALNLRPNQDMAGLAVEQGYYDQSHLIVEFNRFQSATPTQFCREHIIRMG
jgi:AraC-like DNA-binding protein